MSATAHIGASPDLSQDEKNSLRTAWDVEYRKLTNIAQRLERDEQLRVLSGQLSERLSKNWIHWVDLRTIVGSVVQEAIADFGSADASALGSEIGRHDKPQYGRCPRPELACRCLSWRHDLCQELAR